MLKKVLFFLLFTATLISKEGLSIAVCIPALGASDSSVQALIESGRRHFCRLHHVDYFILSDEPPLMEGDDIEWLVVSGGGSLKLFQSLQGYKKTFDHYTYVFVIDPHMIFVAPVGDEVFGKLIAVQKANSTGKNLLFSPCFYGGQPEAVFDLLKSAFVHSEQNLSKEALINRCFKIKPPTRILNPSYAYPENWELEYSKKIIESRS